VTPTSKLLDACRLELGSIDRFGESRCRLGWRESLWWGLCERNTEKLIHRSECRRKRCCLPDDGASIDCRSWGIMAIRSDQVRGTTQEQYIVQGFRTHIDRSTIYNAPSPWFFFLLWEDLSLDYRHARRVSCVGDDRTPNSRRQVRCQGQTCSSLHPVENLVCTHTVAEPLRSGKTSFVPAYRAI
jgi:hypothetical protein